MRASSYAVLVSAWALFASCLAAPCAADWLAVGFRTPEQTFRTFQTGLRAELPDLEYRCLSADFKRRAGAGQFAYREFRRELFRSQPWLKWAARAEVERVVEVAPDRMRVEAEVDTWFHDETFVIEFVREDFYELWVGDRRVHDDFADWREIAGAEDGALVVRVPLPGGLDVGAIGELRAGREWKIDGFSEGMELSP